MNGYVIKINNTEKTQNAYKENENYILGFIRGLSYQIVVLVYAFLIIDLLTCLYNRINGNVLLFEELYIIFFMCILIVYVWKTNILFSFIWNDIFILALLFFNFWIWIHNTQLRMGFFLRWF